MNTLLITTQFITGMMVGIEFIPHGLVLDLFIVRIIFYLDKEDES